MQLLQCLGTVVPTTIKASICAILCLLLLACAVVNQPKKIDTADGAIDSKLSKIFVFREHTRSKSIPLSINGREVTPLASRDAVEITLPPGETTIEVGSHGGATYDQHQIDILPNKQHYFLFDNKNIIVLTERNWLKKSGQISNSDPIETIKFMLGVTWPLLL